MYPIGLLMYNISSTNDTLNTVWPTFLVWLCKYLWLREMGSSMYEYNFIILFHRNMLWVLRRCCWFVDLSIGIHRGIHIQRQLKYSGVKSMLFQLIHSCFVVGTFSSFRRENFHWTYDLQLTEKVQSTVIQILRNTNQAFAILHPQVW